MNYTNLPKPSSSLGQVAPDICISPIEEKMSHLEKAIERLHESANELIDPLMSVLSGDPRNEPAQLNSIHPPSNPEFCQMESRLSTFLRQVDAATVRLREIKSLIQL